MFEYHQRAATDDYRENWERLYGDRAKALIAYLGNGLRKPDRRPATIGEGPQPDDL